MTYRGFFIGSKFFRVELGRQGHTGATCRSRFGREFLQKSSLCQLRGSGEHR